jgi:hypothetical protein
MSLRNLRSGNPTQGEDRALEILHKTVGSLKDVGYYKLKQQLERAAYAYNWPEHILDLTAEEPEELNDEQKRAVRNAYLIIMAKTDGHPVENVLELCPIGDARGAFRLLDNFFHRTTQSGKTAAYQDFFNATMANSDTNIVEFTALVSRKARILIQAGGQADHSAKLSVLL